MQIPEQLVEKFCNEVCSYSHLKIREPKVWKHLDPCLNCCVDHFVDWLEGVPVGGRPGALCIDDENICEF